MGKYLDIARKFEVRSQEQETPVPVPQPQPAQTLKPASTIYGELCNAIPPADVLCVYPEWQGLLVKSVILGMSVWVVRCPIDGIALAKETGFPALILDDVLKMERRTADEARATLLPALITASMQ